VLLRLTPPAGQVSHYRTAMVIYMTTPGAPGADSMNPFMSQCIETTQTVDSALEGVLVVREVTDSARLSMPGSPGTVPTSLRDILRGMTVTRRMDTRGRVLYSSVSGPNVPPSPMGGMAGAMGGLAGRLPALPEQPVRPGDTWADSQPVVLATPGSRATGWVRIANILDSIGQFTGVRIAAVAADGAAQYDVTSSQFNMTVTGTSSGLVLWDLDHGRLLTISSVANGQIRIPELGQVMPFRMSLRTDLTSAIELPGTAPCASR
jgi:hypothetical protein